MHQIYQEHIRHLSAIMLFTQLYTASLYSHHGLMIILIIYNRYNAFDVAYIL